MIRRTITWFKRLCRRRAETPAAGAEMTLEELQETLAQRGLIMETDGARLLFSSPRPILDDDLLRELQRHRPTLLAILPRRGNSASNVSRLERPLVAG